MLAQILLLGLLSCAACEETSDWNEWITTRRALAAGASTYSTANCNCGEGVCTSAPPMCCSGLSLCRSSISRCCNLQTDAANCGQCGNKCTGRTSSCSEGVCVAKQGDHVSQSSFVHCMCTYVVTRSDRYRFGQGAATENVSRMPTDAEMSWQISNCQAELPG